MKEASTEIAALSGTSASRCHSLVRGMMSTSADFIHYRAYVDLIMSDKP